MNLGVSFLHLRLTEKIANPKDESIPKTKPNNELVLVLPIAITAIPIAEMVIDIHTLIEIFSLRNKQLNINDVYNYSTYSSGKIKNINISVIGYENINTPFGIYESIVLSPKSSDGKSAIKNKGDMKIWLTNDEKRLPIKIEVKLKHGSIVLLLNDIES